jgi:ubiquinone/menaquinone biosynthesis C-methylase UbiE
MVGRYYGRSSPELTGFSTVRLLTARLERPASGPILELAAGTGPWTRNLVETAASVTAVDASPEVARLNAERVKSSRVRYVQADLFEWRSDTLYDFVFFGFWLSHVPEHRFVDFCRMVRSALRPDGQAFFIDNLFGQEQTAPNHKEIGRDGVVERKLTDGQTFNIVKIFYEPAALEDRLRGL